MIPIEGRIILLKCTSEKVQDGIHSLLPENTVICLYVHGLGHATLQPDYLREESLLFQTV